MPRKRSIGVIADTHGLLRAEAVAALRGCDLIIHAGDVGSPDVLAALRGLAPLIAVRGNVDKGAWATQLPQSELVDIDDCYLYVLHILEELDLDPSAAGFRAVITGHTHRAKIETRQGVLYFNPGSAGPRRFDLPVTVGRLELADGRLSGKIIHLAT
ncbi:MAG: metallophosphoesterase family protein [Methylobacteriaceae bacterium]|nr:metallophosphoesterase family protein [Methylobacteriaceae bacterium]MBV9636166.1 metallophosphoesterase family protein [Methylobacteriaceae bacterium]MBV9702045.1 metallophosphoesterase family protein [Methylobacteriaceae bacterium]